MEETVSPIVADPSDVRTSLATRGTGHKLAAGEAAEVTSGEGDDVHKQYIGRVHIEPTRALFCSSFVQTCTIRMHARTLRLPPPRFYHREGLQV